MKRQRREEGMAYIVIVMAIALGILFYIFFFLVRNPIIRIATSDLRLYTDSTCAKIIQEPLEPKQAAASFAAAIRNINQNIGIVSLAQDFSGELVYPTMPEKGGLFPSMPGNWSDLKETSEVGVIPFGTTPLFGPTYSCGYFKDGSPAPCKFIGDVKETQHFPKRLFKNSTNAGNTVACKITGKVIFDAFGVSFPIHETLEARVAYWKKPKGFRSYANLDRPSHADMPGLTLIVSPYAQTPNNAPMRFWFYGYAAGFHNYMDILGYDPVHGSDAFKAPFDVVPYYPHPNTSFWRIKTPISVGDPNWEDVYLRKACISAPGMFRNIVLYGVLSHAAHNAHYRRATELLMTMPAHRWRTETRPSVLNNIAPALNPAVAIARFGQDIADPNEGFQIPFISYYGGMHNELPLKHPKPFFRLPNQFKPGVGRKLAFGHLPSLSHNDRKAGWIQPFANQHGKPLYNQSDQIADLNTYIASQLRHCHHMYTSPQIELDAITNSKDYYDPDFDPEVMQIPEYGRFTHHLGKWGHSQNPWTGSNPGPDPPLNALSLVGMLGNAQQCPLDMTDESGIENVGSLRETVFDAWGTPIFDVRWCQKPLDPGNDLRHDILAPLYYTANVDNVNYPIQEGPGTLYFGGTPHFPIALSPGLARITNTSGFKMAKPSASGYPYMQFGAGNYGANLKADGTRNFNSAIIIVSSDGINPGDEYEMFKNLMETRFINRMVIYVYMPFHGNSIYSRWMDGLIADALGVDPGVNKTKYLFHLGPYADEYYDPDNDPDTPAKDYFSSDEEYNWNKYWYDMLDPDPNGGDYYNENVHDKIRKITDLLMKVEPKF